MRLLADGGENYPAWLRAIADVERFSHFESYIVHDDRTGALFADALIERARAGVHVRVVYDWLGAVGATPRVFWYRLVDAGVEVRAFNPPVLWRPFAWASRDHRKMLAVDDRIAYVSGLCIGDAWVGSGDVTPWRASRCSDLAWPTCTINLPTRGPQPDRRCLPTNALAGTICRGAEAWRCGSLAVVPAPRP